MNDTGPGPHGLLGCPLCVKAAVFLLAAILLLGGGLLWWLPKALADNTIALQVCSQTTCKALTDDKQDSMGVHGPLLIQSGSVLAVIGLPNCEACSKVVVSNGQQFFVVGSPADVACRLGGGEFCKSKPR